MFILNIKLQLDFGSPCNETVLIWVKKVGYYSLTKEKTKANDWIIILDESIQLGREKLLVIFGIRASKLKFNRPLTFKELTPLKEIARSSWNGESIHQELKKLKKEIGNIFYAVGDYGNDIRKGLKLSKIKHVHDITHVMALTVKKIYQNDKEYQEFTKAMTKMRKELGQTKYAYLIPPRQRDKARYQNIGIISSWGVKMLKFLEKKSDKELIEKFGWIRKYENFIKELDQIELSIKKISKVIKGKGLSKKTATKAEKHLSRLTGVKGIKLGVAMKSYFQETQTLIKKQTKIVATSDIIESSFGKYKNYLSSNNMAGITNLALSIAAFTSKLTKKEIKKALESTTIRDVQEWTKENIGETLLQKRKAAFAY